MKTEKNRNDRVPFRQVLLYNHFFFSKNNQTSNFTKIRPVGTELFHADRRTDGHDKGCSRVSQFMELALKLRPTAYMAEDKRLLKFRM